jgi:hypothetical protein
LGLRSYGPAPPPHVFSRQQLDDFKRDGSGKQEAQMFKKALIIAGVALMAAAVPTAPAAACHSGCTSSGSTGSTGSTGGTPVPAPAGIGLFAAAALGLIAKRRRAA